MKHFKVTVIYEAEVWETHPDTGVEEPVWKEQYTTYSTWQASVDDCFKEAEEHGYVVIDCVTFKHWEEHQAWLESLEEPIPF